MIVGQQQLADGAAFSGRVGRFGELLTNFAVGEYFELAKQGRLFMASMQAGAVLGTALTSTAVTWTLYNPSGSGHYLSLLQTAVSLTAGQTTTTTGHSIVYAANIDPSAAIPATTTAIVVRAALLGQSAGVGRVYSAATLPATPIAIRVHPWGIHQLVTTATSFGGSSAIDFVNGAIVLSPGTTVTLQGLATTTQISGIISGMWAEIPI